MTVSTEVDHNDYTGNGVTTSFPYTFRIFQKTDLMVQVVDLNENITVLTLDTDYSVSGAGTYSGGSVVLSSPLANGWQISISRELPATQETDLRNQGKFFAEVHEDAFDKLTMLIQQCFGFLRLALRKPSFIANYYDALNNRIRNLRDPSQAQDAATKNYVDSQIVDNTNAWKEGDRILDQKIDANFRKTLRVPEEFIDPLPSIPLRKESLFGWNDLGKPIPVFSMTDTADLAIKLASSNGAALVAINEATLLQLAAPSIYKWMHQSDILTMMTVVGAEVNIDYALQAAIDDGVMSVLFPWGMGKYACSQNVTLPSGFNIFSDGSKRVYLGTSDTVFNNAGAVIIKALGATGIFKLSGRHTFKDLIFDGRDKTVGMMNADSQVSGCRYINCASYRWLRGYGRTSGYTATLFLVGCAANNNYTGIYNTVDSKGTDLVINANDDWGINLQAGANNNSYVNTRVEWNKAGGVMVFNAKEISFEGETIDRNGGPGVAVLNGGELQIIGTSLRRNGANAANGSSDNCHIRVEGAGSKFISAALITKYGADDDGQGNVSPQYSLITTGGSTDMTVSISGGIMSGATVAPARYITTANIRKFQNVIGLPDTSTEGLTQIRDGVPCIGDPVLKGNLPPHGTLNFSLKQLNAGMGTYNAPITRTIEFQSRNESQSAEESYFLKIRTSRLTTNNAVISTLGAELGSASNWGMSTESPGAVSITLSVSADGATINGTLTGIDSGQRYIDIFLRP